MAIDSIGLRQKKKRTENVQISSDSPNDDSLHQFDNHSPVYDQPSFSLLDTETQQRIEDALGNSDDDQIDETPRK